MTLWSEFKNVYFLGIGGIGMSALARWCHAQGFVVGGYDKTSTELTRTLAQEGIDIHYDDKVGRIPTTFYDKSNTLVVRTPAVPDTNVELQYFVSQGYTLMKRSELLGFITEPLLTVAVAGTHGKTSTSSMIAHILYHAGANVSAFLGGITANYGTNLMIGKPTPAIDRRPDIPPFGKHIGVVEADEYDRSFLTLQPDIAVVTNIDPDHLDIYQSFENIRSAFSQFVNQVKIKGHLVHHHSTDFDLDHQKLIYLHSYGIENKEFTAQNIRIQEGCFVFDFVAKNIIISSIKLQVKGRHNIENALAAIMTCILLEVPTDLIKEGIESYKGVKRRFEYIFRDLHTTFIDDYAHHPTELRATLQSARELYPHKIITCVFQPHLYTRTRDFAQEFAQSLDLADEVLLLDIYPAREQPIAGVNSAMLRDLLPSDKAQILSKEQLLQWVDQHSPQVLITAGAGDIDTLVEPIGTILQQKTKTL